MGTYIHVYIDAHVHVRHHLDHYSQRTKFIDLRQLQLHSQSIHHDVSLTLCSSALLFHSRSLRPFVPIVPVDSHQ